MGKQSCDREIPERQLQAHWKRFQPGQDGSQASVEQEGDRACIQQEHRGQRKLKTASQRASCKEGQSQKEGPQSQEGCSFAQEDNHRKEGQEPVEAQGQEGASQESRRQEASQEID